MGHARDADELLEVLGDELGAVIGDDARPGIGVSFAGALDNGFHVRFLHFLADFPVDDEAAAAVEDVKDRKIEQLQAKLARKNEVMAELMEALTEEKKRNGEL